jgi:ABC-type polysaccharide/polyol phosphate export permease
VKRDLVARYKGSAMGLFWAVIQPLVMLVLYTFVFSTIMKVRVGAQEGTGSFALYLLCGLLPWNAFAEPLQRSTGIVLEHSNLIKRVIFPAEILPLYVVIAAVVNQAIGLGILFAALLLTGHPLNLLMIALPAVLLLQVAFTVGLAWIIAGITVFIRDLGPIVGMVLTVWLFLTPVFYPSSLVPDGWRIILRINPMYSVIETYRSLILRGQLPEIGDLAFLSLSAVVVCLVGYRVFTRLQPAFADVL